MWNKKRLLKTTLQRKYIKYEANLIYNFNIHLTCFPLLLWRKLGCYYATLITFFYLQGERRLTVVWLKAYNTQLPAHRPHPEPLLKNPNNIGGTGETSPCLLMQHTLLDNSQQGLRSTLKEQYNILWNTIWIWYEIYAHINKGYMGLSAAVVTKQPHSDATTQGQVTVSEYKTVVVRDIYCNMTLYAFLNFICLL